MSLQRMTLSSLVWIVALACRFDDDRTIGSMQLTQGSATGGTSIGSTESLLPANGGANTNAVIGTSSATGCATDPKICDTDEYCAFDLHCGKETAFGGCAKRPTECPLPTGKERVCGCDGQFYESVCQANALEVSITSLSNCPAVSCTNNDTCAAFVESCASIFGWSAPDALCNNGICSCGQVEIIQ